MMYNVTKVSEKYNKKYKTKVRYYSVVFQPVENNVPLIDMFLWINGMFEDMIDEILVGAKDNDMVRLAFNAPQLDKLMSLPFIRRDQLKNEAFVSKLESMLQSLEEIIMDENVSFGIIHMDMPQGGKAKKKSRF